jgi:3-oxoacyl-[acyl-carrier protein] reductase
VAGCLSVGGLPSGSSTSSGFQRTIAANLTATFLTARAFLRGLAESGHGALVLVGSTAGRFGEAGHADYAAAKAAIQGGLLLSLKNEVREAGARGCG